MSKNGKHIGSKRSRSLYAVIVALVLIAGVSLSAFISAKYATSRKNDSVAEALPFYFESNYLTEGGTAYTLQEGVDTISLEIYNFADILRYSEVDITGSVTLAKGDTVQEKITISLAAGNQNTATVTFSGLEEGTYTVTAVSEPYSKTLKATFVVCGKGDDIVYSVSDNTGSPFLKVEVTSGDYDGNIEITWPSDVRPDNTDKLLESATGISCQVKMEAYGSYTFLFFKDNPSRKYDSGDVVVVKA